MSFFIENLRKTEIWYIKLQLNAIIQWKFCATGEDFTIFSMKMMTFLLFVAFSPAYVAKVKWTLVPRYLTFETILVLLLINKCIAYIKNV